MSIGAREMMLASYGVPRTLYEYGIPFAEPADLKPWERRKKWSAAAQLGELGCLLFYADRENRMGCRRRILMDVDALVEKWKTVIVGLATAHSKADADRQEAAIEDLLTPILAAPIKQVRQFAVKLANALVQDERVPFLVHRAFTVWVDQMRTAPDDDVKVLKTDLAKEIVDLVEEDAKRDLPAAMVRALQWRSPSQLEEVRAVVEREKAEGRGVRLRGRESCLFLEAGGTESEPEVCIQV